MATDLELASSKCWANQAINDEAGLARQRVRSLCWGQESCHAAKLQQAMYYKASIVLGVPTHTAGAYIAAEAAATGRTAAAVSDAVIAAAAQWDQTLGPSIEAERIRGRWNVQAAGTSAGIEQALQTALAVLRTI